MALFIPGPAGRLEAILWRPKAEDSTTREPRAAALVCHPHPLGGGTMHNNVVFRIARGLQHAGLAALRINFRGAGESEGQHDLGRGEEDDARAALDWLEREFPGLPLWAAGFSFGGRVLAGLAAREPRIRRLICVALPCKAFDCSVIRHVRCPTLCLMAGADGFGTLSDLLERVPDLPPNVETDDIPGVDHFFQGATPEVEARIRDHARRHLP